MKSLQKNVAWFALEICLAIVVIMSIPCLIAAVPPIITKRIIERLAIAFGVYDRMGLSTKIEANVVFDYWTKFEPTDEDREAMATTWLHGGSDLGKTTIRLTLDTDEREEWERMINAGFRPVIELWPAGKKGETK